MQEKVSTHVLPVDVGWFKDTADEHIRMLRERAGILKQCGVIVEFQTTTKPGYIVYKDKWQVFAELFNH